MASVTSLDADMRNLRLARYTPQAEAETRAWIENTLGTSLPSGDLLEALKDGVTLCKLANLAIQPQYGAIKFKASAMPFIQMENISHFLKACEIPPLNLPAHDRFLTVDLFEQKDPAQVLQCLGAFSRQANRINPSKFPDVIGPKKAGVATSPTSTGGASNATTWQRALGSTVNQSGTYSMNPSLTGGSTGSHKGSGNGSTLPSAPTSSWSKRSDESNTAPAWNIHQYGYMGGASQGNQGVSFGARRQITSQAPAVPSLAEKQKLRVDKQAESERLRHQETEDQQRRQRAEEEDERRAKVDEERKWEEETRRLRDEERKRIEHQKKEWEEQERQWREDEEARKKEDAALKASMQRAAPDKPRAPSSSVLRGQTLTEWQREQASISKGNNGEVVPTETPEQKRVRELEKQLEEARERERQYQSEREQRLQKEETSSSQPSVAPNEPSRPRSSRESEVSWAGDERDYLRQQHQKTQAGAASNFAPIGGQRPSQSEPKSEPDIPEPLPSQAQNAQSGSELATTSKASQEAQTEVFASAVRAPNRTDGFLFKNIAPSNPLPRISSSREAGDTSLEQSQLRDNRLASQQKTKAGAWASKSLLEREMERERERQREWEANQESVKTAARDSSQGVGEGQTWDVNQYGYMGGDNMNRGSSVGSGINIGGRRQIVGPRAKPPG